ncbi:MAG: glutamate racemase [Rhodobiaceae bacterium]|nr:glutamate racemase [Rhodobiaceae bacterium]
MSDERAIGVFDSGMGGLTVLRALRDSLPQEDLVYLGDTARLPYGTKSADTVTAYALQATRQLLRHDVKMVVIACNTASAVAIQPLAKQHAPLPVIGVVEPGARAGVAATQTNRIGVLATESTVKGGAYARAISALAPDVQIRQQPCALFVALAEEGWGDDAIAEAAASRYLKPLFDDPGTAPDTLVLGCTHFPVLAPAISRVLGDGVTLVDSAATTAESVAAALAEHGLATNDRSNGTERFFATDAPERFARVGGLFFGSPIDATAVELVDLQLT